MTSKTDSPFGERCGEPATHMAHGSQPLCGAHAERMRENLRDPNTVANFLCGRARTEAEIAVMVRMIQ